MNEMFKTFLSVYIVLVNQGCFCTPKKSECGYKQCPQTRDGALNVHLIPHSHMDAGWVKTFDEYYHGTRTTISTANVQMIFHSVLSELLHDRRRKFTFSETAYFWRWWKEQRPNTRATFRSLVQEGRLEFAGGGWVQNDEATLHYLQIIDNFTWGLRKLNDTLGPCGKPKASWQIDTYGHSREQTSLLAQMGYDGLFIGRVDYAERNAMIEEDRMEFMWRGSDVLGKMSDIMTHSLYNLYNAPDGFCFDFLCSDEPIVDDPDSKSFNVEKKVSEFLIQIERQAKYYDHDNIMVTMGGDFTYQSAANWYMNLDKLINHVNSHSGNITDVNVFYSTPSCYLKAIYLYGRRDKAIYTEKSDYFPYGSDAGTYWTGYFTSRPGLKYYIRMAHVFLQVVKQLTVIARMGDSYELHLLRHAANLVLHHDAVTGTSQQHVTYDYLRLLGEAIDSCTKKVSNLLGYLTPTWGGTRRSKNSQQFAVCHELNMSQCWFMENQDAIMLIVYNPSSVKTYYHVRLPAVALHYAIRDHNDEEIEYQLLPLPAAVINLPGRTSSVIQELYFEAENIPPLGYTSYHISPVRDILEENLKKQEREMPSEQDTKEVINTISNEYLKVEVNKQSGMLELIQHVDGAKVAVSQNFYYYSQNQQSKQSGAYSFRPDKPRPTPVTQQATYTVIRGNIVKEIRQRFSDWITQVIRLYRGEEFIELEWIVGPVPIGSDLGKEVVSIFNTNVTNSAQFYTDSNARQMIRRTCWNESATHQQKKLISACFFPVTSRMCLISRNFSTSLCVLTDRAQGGTSYNEGEIELMVHRRLLTDDGFGLEESLNEEEHGVGMVVRGKHRIVFGDSRQEVDGLSFSERVSGAARRWYLEPWLFMTTGDKINKRKWANVRNKRYSILRAHGLPRHVHVLTLEPWKAGAVLLRLENTLEKPTRGRLKNEKSEGPEDYVNKVSHISVNLRHLFNQLQIRRVRETTLAANQWLDDARQMDWSSRYVYQGADDEILPEDAPEYRDDSKAGGEDDRDSRGRGSLYSDEEQHDKDRRAPSNVSGAGKQKKRPKSRRYDESYRRRRSVNVSDNIIENTINGSFSDKFTEKITNTITESDTAHPSTTTKGFPSLTVQHTKLNMLHHPAPTPAAYNSSLVRGTTPTWLKLRSVKNVEKSAVRMKNNWKNVQHRQRPPLKVSQRSVERGSEEVVRSSEEDFSANLKKRPVKRRRLQGQKKNIGKSSGSNQGPDDGITKSMYEMYYKSRPRTVSRSATAGRWTGKTIGRHRYHDKYQRSFPEIKPEGKYEKEAYSSSETDAYKDTLRERRRQVDQDRDTQKDPQQRTKEIKERAKKKHTEDPEGMFRKEMEYINEKILILDGRHKKNNDKVDAHSVENKDELEPQTPDSAEVNASGEELEKKKKMDEYQSADVPFFITDSGSRVDMRSTHPANIDADSSEAKGSGEEMESKKKKMGKKHRVTVTDVPFFVTNSGTIFEEKTGHRSTPAEVEMKTTAVLTSTEHQAVYRADPASRLWDSDKTKATRHDADLELDGMDFYDHETHDIDGHEYEPYKRRKRESLAVEEPASHSEKSEAPEEPEYLITLRPTQIRTFIITFNSNVKPSVRGTIPMNQRD